MSGNCIFCKIINKEIPCNVQYEDDKIIVIHDINPQSEVHLLFMPKTHIVSAAHLDQHNADIVAYIYIKARQVAEQLGLTGYRLITNVGADAGQSVFHLHIHLISGSNLSDKII